MSKGAKSNKKLNVFLNTITLLDDASKSQAIEEFLTE